ncbi:hypothetical protein [Thermococcus sp. Bubb.Bath]|uniref:hypothetical protein n=1 Tax=Thermococcus sp. Bubb.Bath TaxID=1638242 RepID=UPI00143CB1EA|nr:hypothetical protein [Thermococcus sp. Bubb.Bath]
MERSIRLGKRLPPEDIEKSIMGGFDECIGKIEGFLKDGSWKEKKAKNTHNGEGK